MSSHSIPALALVALALTLAGCARSLPKYEKPLAHVDFQRVRTTAYTSTEKDHLQYTDHNACGTRLVSGPVSSAAADWSRWPVGTIFEIVPTGKIYRVDDYGWALTGRNTIDLYEPTTRAMNQWGLRNVQIHILKWGSIPQSYAILSHRKKFHHVRKMLDEMRHGGEI